MHNAQIYKTNSTTWKCYKARAKAQKWLKINKNAKAIAHMQNSQKYPKSTIFA